MINECEILYQTESMLALQLKSIPFVNEVEFEREVRLGDGARADFVAHIIIENQDFKLLGEVKRNLQPRYVFDAIRQVKAYCSDFIHGPVYPVVVSEYISPRSAEILVNQNVSYFDLSGNCRLCFANIYIEKTGEKSRGFEKRRIKSLFGLKSSRMLRLMLNNPARPWQVKDLAAKTELSLGQVSNIRRSLLDQEYATESEVGGICLSQPSDLLNDWQKSYKKNIYNNANTFYSLMNPEERLEAIKEAIAEAGEKKAGIMLSGLSAARWQAPFAKSLSDNFYADKEGIKILRKHLMLESVEIGPNVIIEVPKDSFLFKEATKCAPGLKCTSVIQTYLDLSIAGEREKEAAEHIKSYVLKDIWTNSSRDKI